MTTYSRFSEYKIMWVMVFFDLPTETKIQRKNATDFRKILLNDGFTMFQYSIYIRHCASRENANVHQNRITNHVPKEGTVCIMQLTDKQFSEIKIFEGCMTGNKPKPTAIQLELF